MQDERQIIVSPAPFKAPRLMMAPQGMTVRQIIDRMYDQADVPVVCRDYVLIVEINGKPVPRVGWNMIPELNSHIVIGVPLHGDSGSGGKNPLRTILSIVVVVVAAVATAYVGGAGGWAAAAGYGATASAAMGAAAGALVATAGMLLVNAIAPIRTSDASALSSAQTYSDRSVYSLSGSQNSTNKFGPVPVALGVHKMYPPYGAKAYTEIVGNDEYLRMLFIWGYGPLKIDDIKIGDTLLSDYEDYEIETREGRSDDEEITLFPDSVNQESIGLELKQVDGRAVRAATANVDELSVDICFAGGLLQYDASGNRSNYTVQVKVEYREVGTTPWTTATTFTATEMTTSALRYGYRWKVDRTKSYEVGLTRLTADTDSELIVDEVVWTYLRSIIDEHPVNFPFPVAMTALRIRASEQLQGVIDSLNGIVSSYGETWDGDAWGGEAVTNNPAALYLMALKHPANARARVDAEINLDNLGAWYEFCVTNGYAFNMIRDTKASVWDVLADIAAAGRGSPTITDGLWDVVYDSGEQTIVHHITPRNSWGFEAEKTLFYPPHAFRVPFKNENEGYEDDEIIVYDDGYNASNATRFESLDFVGITDPDLNWKFGRFHIAQARLRPETYSIYQDFEHLVCRRGSKVVVAHDVVMWGSGWGRVKSLVTSGSNTTGVILDDKVTMAAGTSYGCRFRLADAGNTSLVLSVEGVVELTETSELTFQTPVPTASGPQEGDLAMFGEASEETAECLVKSIERSSDYTARLILVDAAPAIYTADQGTIPPFVTHVTNPLDVTRIIPSTPTISNVESGVSALEIYNGVAGKARILATITPGTVNVALGKFKLRYRPVNSTLWQYAETTSDNKTIAVSDVMEGVTYEMQAQAISAYGMPSAWSTAVEEEVVGESTVTYDTVTGLSCTLNGYNAHLSWTDPAQFIKTAYNIYLDDDLLASGVRGNDYVHKEALSSGDHTFTVVTLDVYGAVTAKSADVDVTVQAPATPAPSYAVSGEIAVVSWADCKTTLPIDYYIVTYNGGTDKVKSLKYNIRVDFVGTRAVTVQAVDIAGNVSEEGSVNLIITSIPAPSALTATGKAYTINLALTYSTFDTFEAVEIWSSLTNYRSAAKKDGETATSTFPHTGRALTETRYYWARIRDIYGSHGAWYPSGESAGVEGSTSTDPADYLTILDEAITRSQLVSELLTSVNKIDTKRFVVEDGILEDGIVTGMDGVYQGLTAVSDDHLEYINALILENAAIQETLAVYDNDLDGIKAEYTLKLNAGNRVAGFGLMLESGSPSEFIILADKFQVVDPDDTLDPKAIFTVGKINGVDAVGIDGDLIIDGTILSRHITTNGLTAVPYSTAATGARLLIFPDDETGLQVIDDDGNDALKVIIDGDDVGDVVMGDFDNDTGAKWDKSEGEFEVRGKIKGTSGDFTGEINVGDNSVVVDGVSKSIKVFAPTITIETGVNDKLDWTENSTTYAATLTAGTTYTPATLAAHIQTLMRAAGDDNTTVTYSSTTRKITIANSTLTTLSLLWSSGTNTATSCGQALGFSVSANDTGALTYTADYQAAMRVELGVLS